MLDVRKIEYEGNEERQKEKERMKEYVMEKDSERRRNMHVFYNLTQSVWAV
jgi:hypothetical protein